MEERPSSKPSLWATLICSHQGLTARDRKNQWVVTGWIFAWSLAFVAASYLLKHDIATGSLRWVAAIVPTILGIGMVLVYQRFVVQADELQREIQFQALAVGFGAGLVGSVGLELLEHAGDWSFDVSTPMLLMVVAYSLTIFLGTRRYS